MAVHLVHAVDTEGPLYESVEATFERLEEIFGVRDIEPTQKNLKRIQAGELDLGDQTGLIREALSNHRVSTLGTWTEIREMLHRVTADELRLRVPDEDGRGWVFNWFCLDHVGFVTNPRRRDMGFHNIHDFYVAWLQEQPSARDTIEWHFHPMSTYREAHRCATHYLRTSEIYEILSRRIIERDFFPSCYRAGFQAERPDSHWFLEQYVPYDISNMATADTTDIDGSIDFRNGRSGNWRKAPSDWTVYHPSHDDYQVPGHCRRLIGRALNLRNRIGNLTQDELDLAFARASDGSDILVGMCSHDWRDMQAEIETVHEMLAVATERYPGVPFRYCQADEAFRAQLPAELRERQAPLDFAVSFEPERPGEDVPFIEIRTTAGEVFGPQPYLAIQTRSGRFLHDNLDFGQEPGVWYYAFHADTLPLADVACVGVAANDVLGNTVIRRFEPR